MTYTQWIKTLPCLKCGAYKVDAAHLRIGTDGGMAKKPSERWILPLCRACHETQHRVGERSFYKDVEKAKKLCEALYLFQHQIVPTLDMLAKHRWELF